jgi:hypothetical protein
MSKSGINPFQQSGLKIINIRYFGKLAAFFADAILNPVNADTFPKLGKTVFSVVSLEEADSDQKEYWLSKTPLERLRYMELLRRINYGTGAAARLQRVLEIAERA